MLSIVAEDAVTMDSRSVGSAVWLRLRASWLGQPPAAAAQVGLNPAGTATAAPLLSTVMSRLPPPLVKMPTAVDRVPVVPMDADSPATCKATSMCGPGVGSSTSSTAEKSGYPHGCRHPSSSAQHSTGPKASECQVEQHVLYSAAAPTKVDRIRDCALDTTLPTEDSVCREAAGVPEEVLWRRLPLVVVVLLSPLALAVAALAATLTSGLRSSGSNWALLAASVAAAAAAMLSTWLAAAGVSRLVVVVSASRLLATARASVVETVAAAEEATFAMAAMAPAVWFAMAWSTLASAAPVDDVAAAAADATWRATAHQRSRKPTRW